MRFLALVASAPSKTYSPSPDVDKAWHCLLLDPVLYFDVCTQIRNFQNKDKKLKGRSILISHNPKGAQDPRTERRDRYESTLLAYKRSYFESAPSDFWPENYAMQEEEKGSSEDEAESTDDTNQEPATKKVKIVEKETLAERIKKITLTIKSTKCGDFRVSVFLRSAMKELYDYYVRKMGGEMEGCYFTFNGERLRALNDSVLSFGLDDEDVITAHEVLGDANSEMITITIKEFSVGDLYFRIKPTTKISRVLEEFEKRCKFVKGSHYFKFNGENCADDETFADLEIADGGVIDACKRESGC